MFGVPVVICVNKFAFDSPEELDLVLEIARGYGAQAEVSDHWAQGGKGAIKLAETLIRTCEQNSSFRWVVWGREGEEG